MLCCVAFSASLNAFPLRRGEDSEESCQLVRRSALQDTSYLVGKLVSDRNRKDRRLYHHGAVDSCTLDSTLAGTDVGHRLSPLATHGEKNRKILEPWEAAQKCCESAC